MPSMFAPVVATTEVQTDLAGLNAPPSADEILGYTHEPGDSFTVHYASGREERFTIEQLAGVLNSVEK